MGPLARPEHPTVLFVGTDEAEVARFQALLPQTGGIQAVAVGDLDAVYAHAMDRPVDCVVIGAHQPAGVTGFDLLWQVGEARRLSAPLLMLTEEGDATALAQAVEAGAVDAFAWPDLNAPLLDRAIRYAVASQRAASDLEALQLFDDGSGLPTQLLFWEILTLAVRRAQRNQDHLAVLMVRVDGIEALLEEEDALQDSPPIRALAARIQDCLRASDTIARFDRQHLVILVEGMPRLEDIQIVAEKIVMAGSEALHGPTAGDADLTPVVTVGIALYPANALTAQGLIGGATEAMFASLERGPGGFQFA